MTTPVEIRIVDFNAAQEGIRAVRERVFVAEQGVPLELEWDGLDEQALHVIACTTGGEVVGTGRILDDGHIGRMAVLKDWRGKGIGRRLLLQLLQIAQQHQQPTVFLSAQLEALGFYEKLGFTANGEVFMDAGIPHRRMQRMLVDKTRN